MLSTAKRNTGERPLTGLTISQIEFAISCKTSQIEFAISCIVVIKIFDISYIMRNFALKRNNMEGQIFKRKIYDDMLRW